MTQEQITEAAALLRSPHPDYDDALGSRERAQEILAEAWLAEHPADDAEPITPRWLVEIGGVRNDHPQKTTFNPAGDGIPIGLWEVNDGWKAMLLIVEHHACTIVRGLQTRGSVRRLAAALNIPLTTKG